MAKANSKPFIEGATFHIRLDDRGKPKKNRDGSLSILTLIRLSKEQKDKAPKGFKPFSQTFRTMDEAETWAAARIKELLAPGARNVRPEAPTLTIAQLINEYLDDPNIKGLKSYDYYSDLSNWWKANYGHRKIYDVGPPLLYEARETLKTTGKKEGARTAATVNRYLATMRLIWNWGKAAGWVPQERIWPTRLLLKEPDGRIRHLSSAELDGLLKAAESDPVIRAAILVSVATGLRQGELLRLKWADIDGSAAIIHETKNKTPRRVHLTAQAVAALKSLQPGGKAPPPTAYIFLTPEGKPFKRYQLKTRWVPIKQAAKLENFRWHDLRHTCASYLAQHGATLLEIGSVLGHKTPAMTMRYAHLIQGAALKAHKALDKRLKG